MPYKELKATFLAFTGLLWKLIKLDTKRSEWTDIDKVWDKDKLQTNEVRRYKIA